MNYPRFLLLCASLLLLPFVAAGSWTEQAFEYLRDVEADLVDYTTTSLILEFNNPHDEPRSSDPRVAEKEFLLVVPSVEEKYVELLDYGFTILDSSFKKVGEKSKYGGMTKFPMPSAKDLVELGPAATFRHNYLRSLTFKVISTRSWKGRPHYLVLTYAQVEIKFPDRNQGASPPLDDPFADRLLEKIALNPQCTSLYRISAPSFSLQHYQPFLGWTEFLNQKVAQQPVVRLRTYKEGIFHVSYQDLESLEFEPHTWQLDNLRLFFLGKEVPLWIEGKGTTFSPGTGLYFHSPPLEPSKVGDGNVFWLLCDQQDNPPLRAVPQEPEASSVEILDELDNAETTLLITRKNKYHHRVGQPLVHGRWYWDSIEVGEFKDFPFDLHAINFESTEFQLKVFLSQYVPNVNTQCSLFLNQQPIGTAKWHGRRSYTFETTLPVELLKEGENVLALRPQQGGGNYARETLFVGLELKLPVRLNSELRESFTVNCSQAGWYRLDFETDDPLRVFRLGDDTQFSPLEPAGTEPGRASFYDHMSQQGRYHATQLEHFPTPLLQKVTTPNHLPERQEGCDYLIVAPPQLRDSLQPLISLKQEQGLRVRVASTQEIYDAFNYGIKHSEALPRFFTYAFYRWAAPSLSYICLVGDASDIIGDPRDYPPQAHPDLIPVFRHEQPQQSVRADTAYSFLCGDDYLPDVALGRLSITNPEQLPPIIEKIKHYQANGLKEPWRLRHLFAADDEYTFIELGDFWIANALPPWTVPVRVYQHRFPYENFFRIVARKQSFNATRSLIDNWRQGALTFNYIGHGGPNILSGERLFHLHDIPRLQGARGLPLATFSSCDTCWIDYPMLPVKSSLGEQLVNYPEAGAIASFGPTSGSPSSDHKILIYYLLDSIYQGIEHVGDATLAAKLLFALPHRSKFTLEQFVLLGEPAVAIASPKPTLDFQLSPPRLFGGKGELLSVDAYFPKSFWGRAELVLLDPSLKTIIQKEYPVTAGALHATLPLPRRLSPGQYLVFLNGYNSFKQIFFTGTETLQVVKPELQLTLDYPTVEGKHILPHESTPSTLRFTINNQSELNFDKLVMALRDGATGTGLTSKTLSLQPQDSLELNFTPALPGGLYHLQAELRHPAQASSPWYRLQEDYFIPVASTARQLRALPDELEITPPLLVEGVKPHISVHLYNLSDHFFFELICSLSIIGNEQTRIVQRKVSHLRPYDDLWVEFEPEEPLAAGAYDLLFTAESKQSLEEPLRFAHKMVIKEKKADLVVVKDSVKFSSKNFYTGETIFVTARIKNIGGKEARNFKVYAFKDHPGENKFLLKPFYEHQRRLYSTTCSLKPGQERSVRLRWDAFERPGNCTIFVVANQDKSIPESDYENNQAHAEVEIKPLGNLSLELVEKHPEVIAIGEHAQITYKILSTADYPYENIPVAYSQAFADHHPIPYGEEIIPLLPPASELIRQVEWHVTDLSNRFVIDVNSERELIEPYHEDNVLSTNFIFQLPLSLLTPESKTQWKLGRALGLGSFSSVTFSPDYSLRPTDFKDAHVHQFSPQDILTSRTELTADQQNQMTDGKWLIRPNWLAASPLEDVPPLTLQIPLRQQFETDFFDVYLYTLNEYELEGYQASRLRLKIEDQPDFQDQDFYIDNPLVEARKNYLGRFDTKDGIFDLEIDDVGQQAWGVIHFIGFVPLIASYSSPLVEFEKKQLRKNLLAFIAQLELPSKSRVELAWRWGNIERQELQWSPWQLASLTDDPLLIEPEGTHFQFRLRLFSSEQGDPLIKNISLALQPRK